MGWETLLLQSSNLHTQLIGRFFWGLEPPALYTGAKVWRQRDWAFAPSGQELSLLSLHSLVTREICPKQSPSCLDVWMKGRSKTTERNGFSEAKSTPESAVPCSKRPGVRRKLPGDLSLRVLSAAGHPLRGQIPALQSTLGLKCRDPC